MSQQLIDLGTPDTGDGDSLRVGGDIINDNFTELYTLPTVEEAEAFALTDVTAWNALRIKQLVDARTVDTEAWIVAEKTLLETRSTSGAPAVGVPLDDAEMQLPVEGGANYRIRGELLVVYAYGEAGGFQWNLSVPPVDKLTLFVSDKVTSGANFANETQTYNVKAEIESTGTAFPSQSMGLIVAGSAVIAITTLRGYLNGGVDGGLFKFQWSTWTGGNDTAVNLYPGTWIGLKKVS